MGGFEQTASSDVYKRWCAFGLLSSHSRLHGNSSYRVPWMFDEKAGDAAGDTAVDVLRFFTKLKCRLMPYLFGAAVEAHERGIPTMRAMMLEFPDDPGCDTLDRQYMLGGDLLVAPVFSSDGVVDYYLPAGRWTNFFTGQVVEGGRWMREKHGYLSLPLMVRQNSIVPVGANDHLPDYDYADGVTFQIYALQDGAQVGKTVYMANASAAMTVTASRVGSIINVQVDGAKKPWSVVLKGCVMVKAVNGGEFSPETDGMHIIPVNTANRLIISL